MDQFLAKIPDQPETSDDKPGGRTLCGKASNSITDWLRILNIQQDDDDQDDDVCDDDESDDDRPPIVGITSSNYMCTSRLGPGLSQGHCFV